MALDFQQIYTKIHEIGATARQRRERLESLRREARALFRQTAQDVDALRDKVESAKAVDPAIRCALPLKEALDTHHPTPGLPLNATLIAADGSQINPDRHGAVQYGLVNVGAIVLQPGSGQTPQTFTDSQLLYDDELYTAEGNPLTDGMVALKRDLDERRKLDELSAQYPAPVITFTDGPIELWGAKDGQDAAFSQSLETYKTVLSRLQTNGVTTAGYVDKPAADLVVRLLELMKLGDLSQVENLRAQHPFRGVSDRWLFGEKGNPLLEPGERSAVFQLQAKSEKDYRGLLALHFFYLNVGTHGHPWPVRVEIPRWVADDPEKLDALHAVLIEQCRVMGAKPYPYLLHRAHETAVVKHEEKNQVEQMLLMEIRRAGEETDDGSFKQSAKDLSGRGRFGQ
ncbi:MAG: hypothetical protein CVU44_10235 [Chloroflexi bacterium HGW-Chloroflexi-6]|nr:MAG: hypothetical protein CVU44_10235 [Chloroflexi bacterium HGW-Chloroflexi-6]